MRTFWLMVCGFTLFIAGIAYSAQPGTVAYSKSGKIKQIRFSDTTNAPDTIVVPLDDADWSSSVVSQAMLDFSMMGDHALNDSVNVTFTPAYRISNTGWVTSQFIVGSGATSVVNGQAIGTATSGFTALAPYMRFVIYDGDVTSANFTYDVYVFYPVWK